ncbi:hypothetical protein JTB14_007959 [Gonioctena quinquepunctata]|nr:hypothetical protein JTB14_007959 [Gonioctena quinquepunctata]
MRWLRHYIAHLWTNATLFDPYELEAENSVWILNGSGYKFEWFKRPHSPPTVKDVALDNDNSKAEDDDKIYDTDEDVEFDDDIENGGYETCN